MRRPSDDEVVSLAEALDECSRSTEIGAGGLRFLCRQAARMIKDLRPDLAYEPISPPHSNGVRQSDG